MEKSIIVFIFLFMSSTSFSQKVEATKMIGKWKSNDPECTDFLELKNNGTYTIYNDCYANDAKNSIIETGDWKLSNSNVLEISKRKFFGGGYILWKDSNDFKFSIAIKKSVLHLTYRKVGDKVIAELWRLEK